MLAVIHQHLDEQPSEAKKEAGLFDLLPDFQAWYAAEAAGCGSPLGTDTDPFGQSIGRHVGYARMVAAWNAKCSCGHQRPGVCHSSA